MQEHSASYAGNTVGNLNHQFHHYASCLKISTEKFINRHLTGRTERFNPLYQLQGRGVTCDSYLIVTCDGESIRVAKIYQVPTFCQEQC